MEVIVNLAITVAIVMFILRRMQEVAQKGRDITAPPVPQSMFGDDEEAPDEETPPPLQRFPAAEEFPLPRRFEMPKMEPRARKWSPPPVPAARRMRVPDEDLLEQEYSSVFDVPVQRTGKEARRTVSTKSRLISEREMDQSERRPEIWRMSFGRTGLVHGILMREILGPPVGLRSTPGGIES